MTRAIEVEAGKSSRAIPSRRVAAALARVLGNRPLADGLDARADFAPADSTAPEAPGAWPESRAPRSFRVTVYSCAGRRTSCAR